jgi:hypothetical protein
MVNLIIDYKEQPKLYSQQVTGTAYFQQRKFKLITND